MAQKEEDIEKNLTGDDLPQADALRSSWFKRVQKGILTSTSEKKEIQEGLWYQMSLSASIPVLQQSERRKIRSPNA